MRTVHALAAHRAQALARLADDHARTARVALAVGAAYPDVVDPSQVETNILVLDVGAVGWAAADFIAAAGQAGVHGYPTDGRHARFVWHLDVDDTMTEHAAAVLLDLLRARGAGAGS